MSEIKVEERIEQIRNDQEHGAGYIAREALKTLLESTVSVSPESRDHLKEHFLSLARKLLGIRPGMPAVGHVIARATEMAQAAYFENTDPAVLKSVMTQGLESLIAGLDEAHADTIRVAAKFLKKSLAVLTLSWSSNVQDTLIAAAAKVRRVYVAEARPQCEGHRLARILAEARIPTTLITDAAMGQVLPQVDLCLVGADGVLQDGSLVNKTGSYLMAIGANAHTVPFYSICETFKYHVGAVPFEAEAKPPEQVCAPMAGVEISNLYFEVVPAWLVRGYITELGVVSAQLAARQIHRWQEHLSQKRLFGDWVANPAD